MSAGGTSGNVVLGPGRLWVAPLGTTEPASASAALDAAFVAVGYTEDGNVFESELTSEPIEVAEELDAIKYENTRRLNRLSFQMAEATRRNLILALAGGVQANNSAPVEPTNLSDVVAVMMVWDSDETPGATNARWLFRQAKPSGTISIAHRKAPQKALIPVTFNLEKPSSAAAWKAFPDSSGLVA